MNRRIDTNFVTTIIIICSIFVFSSFYFGPSTLKITTTTATTAEEKEEEKEKKRNYENNIFNHIEAFAQKDEDSRNGNKTPIIKTSKILNFSGLDYADVINSKDINLNRFTVSLWFNTEMNVTGRDVAFLLNKGGFGTDRGGFNLNYGIWLDNKERVKGGIETSTGEDYFISSPQSYSDGIWHNAILTFNEKLYLLNLYIDGLEVATNSTAIGIIPDNTGKQPVRLGANSFAEKGKINGNYTGQLDDIQVWNYGFTKKQIANLFDTESKIAR